MENELLLKNKQLEKEVCRLQNELTETKAHLKQYTAPIRNATYYYAHREELLEKKKLNPICTEKRKEYNKKHYLKLKNKNETNM